MTNKTSSILSAINEIWHFIVGLSNIISCIVSIASCYIAYTIVTQIISLNIDIAPVVEKLQKDSIIIIERPVPIVICDSLSNSPSKRQPAIEQNKDKEGSKNLSSTEIDDIRKHRELFLERTHMLLGK